MKRSYQFEAYDKRGCNPTRAVSLPIPRLPPVMMTIFPVWSGTFSTVQVGLGGTSWLRIPMRLSDMAQTCRG